MNGRHRTVLAITAVGAQLLTGCSGWYLQPLTPQELIAREHPSAIRIRERGIAPYVLDGPRIQGDSLIGSTVISAGTASFGPRMSFGSRVERRIPTASVDQVAVRRADGLKTGLFVAGVTFSGLMALTLAFFSALGQ